MTHSPGPWRLAKSGQIVDVNNRAIARIWNTSKRDQDLAAGGAQVLQPVNVRPELSALLIAPCIRMSIGGNEAGHGEALSSL